MTGIGLGQVQGRVRVRVRAPLKSTSESGLVQDRVCQTRPGQDKVRTGSDRIWGRIPESGSGPV